MGSVLFFQFKSVWFMFHLFSQSVMKKISKTIGESVFFFVWDGLWLIKGNHSKEKIPGLGPLLDKIIDSIAGGCIFVVFSSCLTDL